MGWNSNTARVVLLNRKRAGAISSSVAGSAVSATAHVV